MATPGHFRRGSSDALPPSVACRPGCGPGEPAEANRGRHRLDRRAGAEAAPRAFDPAPDRPDRTAGERGDLLGAAPDLLRAESRQPLGRCEGDVEAAGSEGERPRDDREPPQPAPRPDHGNRRSETGAVVPHRRDDVRQERTGGRLRFEPRPLLARPERGEQNSVEAEGVGEGAEGREGRLRIRGLRDASQPGPSACGSVGRAVEGKGVVSKGAGKSLRQNAGYAP